MHPVIRPSDKNAFLKYENVLPTTISRVNKAAISVLGNEDIEVMLIDENVKKP